MHREDKNLDVQVARSCTNKLGFDVLRNHTHTHNCIFPTITSSGWKKLACLKISVHSLTFEKFEKQKGNIREIGVRNEYA